MRISAPKFTTMDIQGVYDIIHKIATGFEENARQCLISKSNSVLLCVTEQLYSGLDGESEYLEPTYDDDPFFNEEGPWYHRAYAYKAWKRDITPPMRGSMLNLPARPDNVPNLFIDGTFYSEIYAMPSNEGLELNPGNGNGPAIVEKYGDQILELGPTAVDYFNCEYMIPAIDKFFKACGYK